MRIGVFGGSFNPPHLMHLNIAKDLLRLKYLDKVNESGHFFLING